MIEFQGWISDNIAVVVYTTYITITNIKTGESIILNKPEGYKLGVILESFR